MVTRKAFIWRPIIFFLALLLSFIFCLDGCDRHHENLGGHAYKVEKWINAADSIKYVGVDGAIHFLDSAYNTAPGIEPIDLFRKYDFILGMVMFNKINYDAAQAYTDSVFSLFRDEGLQDVYKKEYARGFIWQGKIYRAQRKYNEAYRYFYEGKKIIESIADTCALNPYNNQIANVYFDQEDYKQAGKYYRLAFDNTLYCTDHANFNEAFAERQGNLSNIAVCFAHQGLLDSSMYYYNRALEFIDHNEHRFPDRRIFMEMARAVIQSNVSDVYLKMGDFPKAEELLEKSIRVNVRKGYDNRFAQNSQAKRISIYLQTGQLHSAEAELASLKISLDTLKNANVSLLWHELISNFYEKKGDFRAAHTTFKKYASLKDSLNRFRMKISGIDTVLEGLENRHQLELAAKKNELSRLYLLAAIFVSVIAVTSTYLLRRNGKRTEKNLKELTRLNQQIVDQNEHMQNALNVLEQSQQENARMMKIVAHDLRNPVGAVKMAASILLEGVDAASQQEMLEIIDTSASDSLQLINSLLRSSSSPDETRKEPVDLQVVAIYCIDMLRFKAEEKNQRITLNAERVSVFSDREKMWRVVSNLIANAIKFSPAGTVIDVHLENRGAVALLSIEDQGIGIPDSLTDKIFDMHADAGRLGTAGEQSFGLGLGISRQIIQAHGGKLWFERKKDEGTIFFVELPVRDVTVVQTT